MGLRIAFLRPHLGAGGAERLIVDAAHELIAKGHDVSFHVPDSREKTQLEEIPAAMPFYRDGAWLPEDIGGRFQVACAVVRTFAAARRLVAIRPGYDLVISDLVPHVLPWLKRRTAARVVYCWYQNDTGPFDRWGTKGLAAADRLLVSSRSTVKEFQKTFPALASKPIEVIYPGVTAMDDFARQARRARISEPPGVDSNAIVLLSMGPFDPRTNFPLAIRALAALRMRVPPDTFNRLTLVIAATGDERAAHAAATQAALEQEAHARDLEGRVRFVEVSSDVVQAAWLERAFVVLYTAESEHFGIVPLQAMAAGRPVIAVNRGGRQETVVVGRTGLLCEPTPDAFAAAIARFLNEPELAARMGSAGRAHVDGRFSRERFGDQLDAIVRQVVGDSSTPRASRAQPSSQVGLADLRAPLRRRSSSD